MDKKDYGRRLANAIATQMRRKGITQEQLGNKIGVSQRTISDYASGKRHHLMMSWLVWLGSWKSV